MIFQVLFSNVAVVVRCLSLVLSIAEDDAFSVYEEVLPVAGSWGRLALGLGLPPNIKSLISKKHPNDPKDCLLAVVEEWLMGIHNVKKYGHPSWRALVHIVAHPAGGANPALAHSIAAKHPGNHHSHVTECPVVSDLLVSLVIFAPDGESLTVQTTHHAHSKSILH